MKDQLTSSLAWKKSLGTLQTNGRYSEICNGRYIRYCEVCGREPLAEGFVVPTKGWYYCLDHEPEDHEHNTFETTDHIPENDCS